MPGRSSSVTAMPTMHEHVDDGTEQKQRVRHCPKNVRSVLLPEEKRSDSQEKAQTQPHRDSKRLVV